MRSPTRIALAACVAAIAGAVALATPASADITVTPTQLTDADSTSTNPAQAVRGGPARLAFTITSMHRTASTTKVQVLLPEDAPIAEVYPLSAPDWAPAVAEKQLDKPIRGVHGTQIDQVVTAITWTTVPGRAIKPGWSSVVQVEAGPMPNVDQIVLRLAQTYSDGTVTRSDATVKLSPPTGQAAQGHDAHGGGAAQEPAATTPDEDSGSGGGTKLALLISVLLIGLLGGTVLGGFALPRLRRGAAGLTVSREELDPSGDSADVPSGQPAHR